MRRDPLRRAACAGRRRLAGAAYLPGSTGSGGEHVRWGGGWEHVHTENWEVYEMQTVGSARGIQDIRADASRMSEAGGDGYTPSTRSRGNLGCQLCSESNGARDIANLRGLGPEQWQLFTQGNMVQHVQGLCGGQFHRQQTRVY